MGDFGRALLGFSHAGNRKLLRDRSGGSSSASNSGIRRGSVQTEPLLSMFRCMARSRVGSPAQIRLSCGRCWQQLWLQPGWRLRVSGGITADSLPPWSSELPVCSFAGFMGPPLGLVHTAACAAIALAIRCVPIQRPTPLASAYQSLRQRWCCRLVSSRYAGGRPLPARWVSQSSAAATACAVSSHWLLAPALRLPRRDADSSFEIPDQADKADSNRAVTSSTDPMPST